VLIEVKTMRMKGHAQHDPAEYVPKEMFDYWKARDPITLYEKYLTEHKIWDAKTKSEIDARIERELDVEQKFAEESPLPPPELAAQGVYCEGGCHNITANWQRSKKELTPPNCSIEVAWQVEGYGDLDKAAVGTKQAAPSPPAGNGSKSSKPVGKPPVKVAAKPPAKAPVKTEDSIPAASRVPFGRGPKDKAFRRDAQGKAGRR
jgi:hypothetical protein